MKIVMMQEQYNGEWFDIWETETEKLENAWQEIDDKPDCGAWIKFKGEDDILIVNGGF